MPTSPYDDNTIALYPFLDPAHLQYKLRRGEIQPNERRSYFCQYYGSLTGATYAIGEWPRNGLPIKDEPMLATICIFLNITDFDENKIIENNDASKSIKYLIESGANSYESLSYLLNYFNNYPSKYDTGTISCLDFFVEQCKKYDNSFGFRPDDLSIENLKNFNSIAISYFEKRQIDLEMNPDSTKYPDFPHIRSFVDGIDFDQLIEQRIYQEQLFKLTDKRERFDDLSRNLGYGTNNRGGLVKAVLAPVGWAVQAVAMKPVDRELEALRASRVEQLTARYLKEQRLEGVEYLGAADVATIQNQQIAEENDLLAKRNAMLLAREVDLASRTL